MVVPSEASASTVRCAGEVTRAAAPVPGFEDDAANALDYRFFCNENLRAFSFISGVELSYFTAELTSEPTAESPTAANLSCEGPLPGYGFGCRALGSSNQVAYNQAISGQLETTKDPCPRFRDQEVPRFFITAATTQATTTGSTFQTSSEPMRLRNAIDCPKPKPRPSGKQKGKGEGKGSTSRRED